MNNLFEMGSLFFEISHELDILDIVFKLPYVRH